MKRLTTQEFNQLSREEQKEAVLNFQEPEHLYHPRHARPVEIDNGEKEYFELINKGEIIPEHFA